MNLLVIYEDNHLLAVAKPAGVPTQGDQTGDESLFDQCKRYLAQKYHKQGNVYVGMVHRLDRPTEGLVLFAKTSKAASRLSEQFREGKVTKKYLAVVTGEVSESEGVLEAYLFPGSQNKTKISLTPGCNSKRAVLSFRKLPRRHPAFPDTTFLEITPQTGRKHQIRVQLSFIGHAIIGDRKYGCRIPLKAGRIALLAFSLQVDHPISKERLKLEIPIDPNWPKIQNVKRE